MITRAILFMCLTAGALAEDFALLDNGSEWNYLHDASDQGTAWRAVDFDDSAWNTGLAPFGQGFFAQPLGTLLERNGGLTTYFRTEFNASTELLGKLKQGVIDLVRDDGVVIYINGVEVRRDNLPDGEITFETEALKAIAGAAEFEVISTAFSASLLTAGTNTIAVELHNNSLASQDLYLELRLAGRDGLEPLGGSRPPCVIDFESAQHVIPSGMGVLRSLDPAYAGIEYAYSRSGSDGQVTRVDSADFDSTVLAGVDTLFNLTTGPIDLQNYTDVRVSFDLMAEGSLGRSTDYVTAKLFIGGGSNLSPTQQIPWLDLRSSPGNAYTQLFAEDAALRYEVPTDPQTPIADWVAIDFDDSNWIGGVNGVGYERSSGFLPLINTDLEVEMYNINASVNLRIPFTLTEVELADAVDLALDMRYDDGFVVWLNGTEIARKNAPLELLWNSQAATIHPDQDAVIYERLLLSGQQNLLRVGKNVLAIRGLNRPSTSSDMLIQSRLLIERQSNIPPDTLDAFIGAFRTKTSPTRLVPDHANVLTIHIAGRNTGGSGAAFYLDNITVTGKPIVADSFSTAIALTDELTAVDVEANPDPDGDGLPLLLEYAFGGSFIGGDDSAALLPQVSYDELGFLTVQFRMLSGFRLGDAEDGYDVADLRYTPQLTYDLSNWRDGSGVPPFEQVGKIVSNNDGTVTVSLRSRRRLQEEQSRAYFRVLVEVARPLGVILTDAGS